MGLYIAEQFGDEVCESVTLSLNYSVTFRIITPAKCDSRTFKFWSHAPHVHTILILLSIDCVDLLF